MKKLCFAILSIFLPLVLVLGGCNNNLSPQSVSFLDITPYSKTPTQIKVVYQDEKRYKEMFTDIFIKTDKDNTILTFTVEIGKTYEFTLSKQDELYSLTKLIADKNVTNATFTKYQDAISKTFLIASNQTCNLTFFAVVSKNENFEQLQDSSIVSNQLNVLMKQKISENDWKKMHNIVI